MVLKKLSTQQAGNQKVICFFYAPNLTITLKKIYTSNS